MTRGCLNPDRGLPSVSYESLIDDPGLVSRMSEVDRMVRLCEGAMVGFCSITVREDALDASAEAAERLEGVPGGGKAAVSNILDAASSVDPWSPWSMADMMGEESSGNVISRILGSSTVRALAAELRGSGLPMPVQGALALRILHEPPFLDEGSGMAALAWNRAFLCGYSQVFRGASFESRLLRSEARYRELVSTEGDDGRRRFVMFCLEEEREALSDLLGSVSL